MQLKFCLIPNILSLCSFYFLSIFSFGGLNLFCSSHMSSSGHLGFIWTSNKTFRFPFPFLFKKRRSLLSLNQTRPIVFMGYLFSFLIAGPRPSFPLSNPSSFASLSPSIPLLPSFTQRRLPPLLAAQRGARVIACGCRSCPRESPVRL